MWDLVPWPGIEPRSPALGAQCLFHWTTREVPESRVLKGNVYPHVCSSIIHDSLRRQKPPKCLLTDEWRNTMWYTHNGILFSFRKEWNSDTCYNMDEPWRHSVQLLSRVRLFATLWIVVRLSMDGPQSLSHVRLFATLWIAARLSMDRPPCPSPTPRVHSNSYPSSQWCHPAISSCRPLLLLLPIHPSIRVFSNKSTLRVRWPKYWSFSFSISPSNEHPGLISFRMDWLDLLAVQGTLESLIQHCRSKASILRCSAFFTVQLSHPYMTTGKTTALTRRTFVGKVRSLLLNMLSRLVITFLPRSKRLLISWLQSPSAVILEPPQKSLTLFPLFPHLFPMKWWDQMPWS